MYMYCICQFTCILSVAQLVYCIINYVSINRMQEAEKELERIRISYQEHSEVHIHVHVHVQHIVHLLVHVLIMSIIVAIVCC